MHAISTISGLLLVVDFQGRLMPAIEGAEAVLREASRLIRGAALLDVPVVYTEQNPKGLGGTDPALLLPEARIVTKMTFDATSAPDFFPAIGAAERIVVIGCEAHVCVLQTVLGLLEVGREVAVVADAVGSRKAESCSLALDRMARHGAEIVTAEMVLFEWLESAEHPRFREAIALIK